MHRKVRWLGSVAALDADSMIGSIVRLVDAPGDPRNGHCFRITEAWPMHGGTYYNAGAYIGIDAPEGAEIHLVRGKIWNFTLKAPQPVQVSASASASASASDVSNWGPALETVTGLLRSWADFTPGVDPNHFAGGILGLKFERNLRGRVFDLYEQRTDEWTRTDGAPDGAEVDGWPALPPPTWQREYFSFALRGTSQTTVCSQCRGTGTRSCPVATVCRECGGRGNHGYNTFYAQRAVATSGYLPADHRLCTSCSGRGQRLCGDCGGTGSVRCRTCWGWGKSTDYRRLSILREPRETHQFEVSGSGAAFRPDEWLTEPDLVPLSDAEAQMFNALAAAPVDPIAIDRATFVEVANALRVDYRGPSGDTETAWLTYPENRVIAPATEAGRRSYRMHRIRMIALIWVACIGAVGVGLVAVLDAIGPW